MRVKDVMTKNVVSIAPEASVAEALDIMTRSHLSGLPVVDGAGRLVGVLSEADFLRRFELGSEKPSPNWFESLFLPGRTAAVYARAHARHVEEIMSTDVITVEENANLGEAAALMEAKHVKRLPVVADGDLVGMVTRADFVRVLAESLRKPREQAVVSDEEIKQRIEAEMRAQVWAPIATIDVTVNDGVVGLHGVLTDERERTALHALVENIDGVRSVEDNIVWADGFSGLAPPIG